MKATCAKVNQWEPSRSYITVRVHKWSQDRKWSRTANDPQTGPQMILDRKWSPYWTANDPDQKIRNGMDRRIGWIGNWRTWIPVFLSLCLNARQTEIFTEFPLTDYFKFLDDIWCFLRNVERFQKLRSFVRRRNNRACAYYEIGICMCMTLMYQSNRSLNIPPGIPRAFDVCSCSRGREFDELSLPGDGHLITTHRGRGIGSLASISYYEPRWFLVAW